MGSSAKNITISEDVLELTCFQAEADTAMFTMYSVLRSDGYTASVVLDTEDTDNYMQAAYVVQRTPGMLCLKRKHQLIDAHVCAVRECLNPLYHFMFSLGVITTMASMEQARSSLQIDWRSLKRHSNCYQHVVRSSQSYTKSSLICRNLSFALSMVTPKQDRGSSGRRDGCEVERTEEEEHYPTFARLGQSPSAPGSCTLSCIFA